MSKKQTQPESSSNPTNQSSSTKIITRNFIRSDTTESLEEIQRPVPIDVYHTPLNKEEQRIKAAKARYDQDVRKHQVVDIKANKPEEDWQVAYVWSFIVKFNLKNQISKLECLEDFENCLKAPVANRPDDILEGILICFLSNIKNTRSGSKSITPENLQHQLSNFITDQLTNTSEWTVWDRGWPINEEDRGSCCTSDPYRSELGRLRYYGEPSNARAAKNPIKRMEDKGGGIFELDWHERISLLRQLVDWQLTYSDTIRDKIHLEFPAKAHDTKAKKAPQAEVDEKESIVVKELGLTRDRARVWSFDDSWRLYQSGNPYKRPCQLLPITTDRESYDKLLNDLETYSTQPDSSSNNVAKGSKEANEAKKLIQAKTNEGALAEKLRERIETVEKEEARIQRARRKIAQALEMQQLAEERAEMRSTRTRRQSKKVDYVYNDHSDIESDSGPSKRHKHSPEFDGLDSKGKPIIPGERRSARQSGKQAEIVEIEMTPVSEVEPAEEKEPVPDEEPVLVKPISEVRPVSVESVPEVEPVSKMESDSKMEPVPEVERVLEVRKLSVEPIAGIESVAVVEPLSELPPMSEVEQISQQEPVSEVEPVLVVEPAPEVETIPEAEPVPISEMEPVPEVASSLQPMLVDGGGSVEMSRNASSGSSIHSHISVCESQPENDDTTVVEEQIETTPKPSRPKLKSKSKLKSKAQSKSQSKSKPKAKPQPKPKPKSQTITEPKSKLPAQPLSRSQSNNGSNGIGSSSNGNNNGNSTNESFANNNNSFNDDDDNSSEVNSLLISEPESEAEAKAQARAEAEAKAIAEKKKKKKMKGYAWVEEIIPYEQMSPAQREYWTRHDFQGYD